MTILTAKLADAADAIDQIRARTDETTSRIRQVEDDPDLTVEARRHRVAPLRAELAQQTQAAAEQIRGTLGLVASQANHHLDHLARDTVDQTRLSRAFARVQPLLAGGQTPGVIAETLAEDGDVDALVALREAVPAWSLGLAGDERERQVAADNARSAVDTHLRRVADTDTAEAIDAAKGAAHQHDRLEAALLYANDPSPQADIRVGLADLMETV